MKTSSSILKTNVFLRFDTWQFLCWSNNLYTLDLKKYFFSFFLFLSFSWNCFHLLQYWPKHTETLEKDFKWFQLNKNIFATNLAKFLLQLNYLNRFHTFAFRRNLRSLKTAGKVKKSILSLLILTVFFRFFLSSTLPFSLYCIYCRVKEALEYFQLQHFTIFCAINNTGPLSMTNNGFFYY